MSRRGLPRWIIVYILGLFLAILLIAYLSVSGRRDQPYQEWVVVSAATRELIMFPAIASGVVSALVVGKLVMPTSAFSFAIPCRGLVGQCAPIVGVLWLTATLGYLAGFTPLLLAAVQTATDGHLAALPLITASLFLLFSVVVGSVLGALLGATVGIISAVAVVFSISVLTLWFGDSWRLIAPIAGQYPQPGQYESGVLIGARFIALGVLALSAVMVALSLRPFRSPRFKLLFISAGISILLVAISTHLVHPDLYRLQADPARVCEDAGKGISVCLHAAHSADLDNSVRSVSYVLDRYPVDALSVIPEGKVIDQSLIYVEDPKVVQGSVVVAIDPGYGFAAGDTVSAVLSGLVACDPLAWNNSANLSERVSSRLLGLNNESVNAPIGGTLDGPTSTFVEAAEDEIDSLTDSEFRRGLEQLAGAVASCSASSDQFVSAARGGSR